MTRVVVYCGSSAGKSSVFRNAAAELAEAMADRRIGMVYGGARVGLMGVMADTMLHAGAEVVGVIPRFLVDHEIAHAGLTELLVVDDMAERKKIMLSRADWVIALPGGYGTLDEMFETLTEAQLGLHTKPCGFLNTAGYYTHLMAFLDTARDAGFLKDLHRDLAVFADNPETLLDLLSDREKLLKYRSGSGKWQ
jgi:uncharacterized protein (TIGR00730 family)